MSQTEVLSALPTAASSHIAHGIGKTLPPKGRAISKLSSRNNRRKRRRDSREHDASAKKSRGAKRTAGRVPIPSFTPLSDEIRDEEAAPLRSESKPCSSLQPEVGAPDVLAAAPQTDGSSGEPNAISDADGRRRAANSTDCADDASSHNEQPRAKRQKISDRNEGDKAETQRPVGGEAASGVAGDGRNSCVSEQQEKEQRCPQITAKSDLLSVSSGVGVVPMQGVEIDETDGKGGTDNSPQNEISSSDDSRPSRSLSEESKPNNAESGLPNQSSPQAGETQKMCNSNDDNDNEAAIAKTMGCKSSKYFDSSKSAQPEVIELLDDEPDLHEDVKPSAKTEKSATRKKANPRKRKPPKATNSETKQDEKKMPKDRKAKQRNKATAKVKESNPPKQAKASTGKKQCYACSSCKCNSRAGTATTPQKFPSLSGSDARQEQQLVNRLQRIERDIAWKEGQRNDVARELKKLRSRMSKKWEGQSSDTKVQPRFLADVDESDELGSCSHSKLSIGEVNRAQRRVFGKQKTHQPTLTQMVGDPNDDVGDDDVSPASLKAEKQATEGTPENIKSSDVKDEVDSPDFLALLWADSGPTKEETTQCFGKMDDYNDALANAKSIESTGGWAKATANALQIDEEEGFDALVDLFDESMETESVAQNDNDAMLDTSPVSRSLLSPDRQKVVVEIETAVKNEPNKAEAIATVCPQWQENVAFAQAQAVPEEVDHALTNVQQAKADLERMKQKVFQAFFARHQTLELFERSLQGAKGRFSAKGGGDGCVD